MPIERGGYSLYLYGSGDFGTSGVIHEGSASVSASASMSASGGRSLKSSAAASVSSATAASAMRERESGALASVTSTIIAAGEGVVIKRTDKLAYGGGVYGYNVFDNADLQTISSATSAGSTASGEKIHLGSASASASASSASSSERVREANVPTNLADGTFNSYAYTTASAQGAFTVNSQPRTVTARATPALVVERVRFTTQLSVVESATIAIGREKWEIITNDSNIWTTIAA